MCFNISPCHTHTHTHRHGPCLISGIQSSWVYKSWNCTPAQNWSLSNFTSVPPHFFLYSLPFTFLLSILCFHFFPFHLYIFLFLASSSYCFYLKCLFVLLNLFLLFISQCNPSLECIICNIFHTNRQLSNTKRLPPAPLTGNMDDIHHLISMILYFCWETLHPAISMDITLMCHLPKYCYRISTAMHSRNPPFSGSMRPPTLQKLHRIGSRNTTKSPMHWHDLQTSLSPIQLSNNEM